MWVRAKVKTQITSMDPAMQVTFSIQNGSKWLAFHEPDIVPDLPWRLNHKHLNVRMKEKQFLELFEEIHSS